MIWIGFFFFATLCFVLMLMVFRLEKRVDKLECECGLSGDCKVTITSVPEDAECTYVTPESLREEDSRPENPICYSPDGVRPWGSIGNEKLNPTIPIPIIHRDFTFSGKDVKEAIRPFPVHNIHMVDSIQEVRDALLKGFTVSVGDEQAREWFPKSVYSERRMFAFYFVGVADLDRFNDLVREGAEEQKQARAEAGDCEVRSPSPWPTSKEQTGDGGGQGEARRSLLTD